MVIFYCKAYYASPNSEEPELCVMTPTPPIAQNEQTNTDNLNEMASSSSASSASSNFQAELDVDVKKTQAVSTSSASSVTGINSELTTLTRISTTEKESSCFSSSSSSSTASSKSASISNLNKSNETKLENQNLDSNNNNKNIDQKVYKKQQSDSFRLNYGQNRPQNYQRMNSFNHKPNRYNNNSYSNQNEPLTVQTSNSRAYQQMASPYYYNHSNPISPIKMGQKQNQKQNVQPRNIKGSDILKINPTMNASSYVGSVIGSVYPENKTNDGQISSSATKSYTQNSQSHNNVAAAAEAIANYANQTASVNSSSILNIAAHNIPRQNPNVYPEFLSHQAKNTSNATQVQPQFVYPNFYYYTNPNLPVNQSNIYIDPNVQRSTGPLTPQSFAQYYQAQTATLNNTDNQTQITSQNGANSQSTITNAFETANGNQNQNVANSASVDQLDDMMQKCLNLNQYDPQQYSAQPVYYVAHLPNSQYYTYYYTPNGPVLGPNPGQSQLQFIAPVPTTSSTTSAPGVQANQSYSNQPGFQQQQPLMSHLYMQQQMMSGTMVPQNTQTVPVLQIPTIPYYNSNQQPIMPQVLSQGQQYQYQQISQTSPQQNTYPGNSQMYQYSSGITPKGSNLNQNNIQNRSTQNNQNVQRSNFKT